MAKGERSRAGGWVGAALVLLLIGGVVFGLMNRQFIQDYVRALQFEPSPPVVAVQQHLELTAAGDRIFLASEPTIDGSQRFNEQCADVTHSDEGHVLGCYTNEKIHLFQVNDERVAGIVDVTAAHELLHAAYYRLGSIERREVKEQLTAEYARLADADEAFAERMALYEHLSEDAFANELHSVLGTEVHELSPELEEHYAQWFTDREGLVEAFDAYHTVFVDLQAQAEALETEMTGLREDVERRKVEYDAAVEQFNADAQNFSARNDNFEFSEDPAEFERIRGELESRRAALDEFHSTLEADIAHYNDLRDQLSELSEVSSNLDEQLDSDLAPVTSRATE